MLTKIDTDTPSLPPQAFRCGVPEEKTMSAEAAREAAELEAYFPDTYRRIPQLALFSENSMCVQLVAVWRHI